MGRKLPDDGTPTRRTYLGMAGTALGATALTSGTAAAGEKADDSDDTQELTVDDGGDDALIVIDEPGAYELAEDIDVPENETGILIVADDVSLDGNGKTVSGSGSGRGIFVDDSVQDQGADDATIRNIALKDLQIGIELFEPQRTRIIDTCVHDCQTGFVQTNDTDETILRDNEFDNAPVRLGTSSEAAVIGNTIVGAAGAGLRLSDTFTATIINNEIADNHGPGVSVSNSGRNQLLNNEITDNAGSGIVFEVADSNRVISNAITDNGGAGVVIDAESNDNDVFDNDLSGNADGPCTVDDAASGNVFSGNDPECNDT